MHIRSCASRMLNSNGLLIITHYIYVMNGSGKKCVDDALRSRIPEVPEGMIRSSLRINIETYGRSGSAIVEYQEIG